MPNIDDDILRGHRIQSNSLYELNRWNWGPTKEEIDKIVNPFSTLTPFNGNLSVPAKPVRVIFENNNVIDIFPAEDKPIKVVRFETTDIYLKGGKLYINEKGLI